MRSASLFLNRLVHHARRAPCAAALAIVIALSAGCGDGHGEHTTGEPLPPESACGGDARAMKFAAGLERASDDASVKIRFVDASPAPPSKGDNTFTVELLDSAGAPIDGAAMTVTPFMPDHGHGGSAVSAVASSELPGRYSVDPVTLFMPGIWDVTFAVELPGQPAETVVFTFCIEG